VVPDFTPGYAIATRRLLRTADFRALATTLSGKSAATDSAKVITSASPPLMAGPKIIRGNIPAIGHLCDDYSPALGWDRAQIF